MSDKGTHSHSNRHRMHEVSDTPRTEQARENYRVDVYDNPKGFCVTEPVHASFARDLERENNELRKDKERLDWLLENKYALGPEQDLSNCKHTSAKSYQLIYTRKNIDKAMEEAQ